MSTYEHGLNILGRGATLGPRGRNTLLGHVARLRGVALGIDIKMWSNADAYATGDVVYSNHSYFRALRPISPPFLPSLMSGEVPGDSDVWREITEAQAYAHAPTVLGMFDLGVVQHNMDALKPVSLEIGRILVKSGTDVINQAIAGSKQPWYKSDLPGETARNNCKAHIQWHADALSKASGAPTSTYASGDDLKKWVEQAFVEGNAVETGAAYLDAAWSKMWDEIQTALEKIPHDIAKAAAGAIKAAAGAAGAGAAEGFGIPTWLFWTAGAAIVGGVGYGVYKWKFGGRR